MNVKYAFTDKTKTAPNPALFFLHVSACPTFFQYESLQTSTTFSSHQQYHVTQISEMPSHSSSLGYQYAVHVLLARVQHTMQVVQDIWSCISWLYESFHNTIKWGISEQYKFLYIIIACKVTVKLSHINWVPCVTLDTHIFGNQCTLAFIVLPAMYESEDSAAQGQVHKRC